MIIYLIKFNPFKTELQQVIWASDEFTIFFGLVAIFILYKNQLDPTTSLKLSFVIIGVISGSLTKNIIIIISQATLEAYNKIK